MRQFTPTVTEPVVRRTLPPLSNLNPDSYGLLLRRFLVRGPMICPTLPDDQRSNGAMAGNGYAIERVGQRTEKKRYTLISCEE